MDTTALIIEHASQAGVVGSAMPDVLRRSADHFSATEVSAESVQQFLTRLKTDAPHLFAAPVPGPGGPRATTPPAWMSPSEKLTWGRAHTPQPPVQRRPQPYTPTPEQLKSLEGKKPTERLTAFRAWQDQAHGGRHG